MEAQDKLMLLKIIASVEVVFVPYQIQNDILDPALAAVQERRFNYRERGIPWSIGGGGGDRILGFLCLKRLQLAGFLQLHKDRAELQRKGVSLRRVCACMSLVGLPTLRDAWPILSHLEQLHADRRSLQNEGYIIERQVFRKKLFQYAVEATPLLIMGYVDTACDACGRLGWKLTDSGRAALKLGQPEADELPRFERALLKVYNATIRELIDQRDHWTTEKGLGIPLSAGLWLTTAERADYESRKLQPDKVTKQTNGQANGSLHRPHRPQLEGESHE